MRLDVAAVKQRERKIQAASARDDQLGAIRIAGLTMIFENEADRRRQTVAGARAGRVDAAHRRIGRSRIVRTCAHGVDERLFVDMEIVSAAPIHFEVVGQLVVTVNRESTRDLHVTNLKTTARESSGDGWILVIRTEVRAAR